MLDWAKSRRIGFSHMVSLGDRADVDFGDLLDHLASDASFSARVMTPTVVDVSIAELLLSYAADMNADLIVMGGYGHTRIYELLLGGVTRTMLGSMTAPVLMSH